MTKERAATAARFPSGTRVQVQWTARGLPRGVAGLGARVIAHTDSGALLVRLDGAEAGDDLLTLLTDEVVHERDATPSPPPGLLPLH